jgi:hypothetical protein
VNAFGDSGFGILSAPVQVEVNASGVMQQDPANPGVYGDDFGFSSGGTLAGTLGSSTTAASGNIDQVNGGNGFSVIAYLGVADANTAHTAGGTILTYNGVAESAAAIAEGAYTFWGNEYIYKATVGNNAEINLVDTRIVNNIGTYADGVKLISIANMHATRNGPTSDPYHN